MRRHLAAGPLALLTAAALLVAGCGGGDELSKEEYQTQVRDAIEPVVETSQNLASDATEAQSVDDLADPLAEAETTYADTASTLDDIEPPEDVADLHERLITAHEEIATAAGEAGTAAEEGDEEGVRPFQEAGTAYQTELQELQGQFQEQDYDFGGAASP